MTNEHCYDIKQTGFVLPLMLGVLALGSVLVAGLFLLARLEAQSGMNGLNAARALEVSETGLSEVVAWWDPVRFNQLPTAALLTLPTRSLGAGAYTATLTRLSPGLFQVEVAGWYQSGPNLPAAQRRLRSILRLEHHGPLIQGALTVLDSVVWDQASQVAGGDTIPTGWEALCSPDTAVAGLITAPTTSIVLGSCAGCMSGAPATRTDSSLGPAALTSWGTQGYAGLAARAFFSPVGTLGPIAPRVTAPSVCAVSDSLNWGEPWRSGPAAACAGYAPVVHSPGGLILTGGRGQGILLVDGDLELGGGVEYYGLVVVRGAVRNGPGGGTVLGAVLAGGISLTSNPPGGALSIHYSACVLPPTTSGISQALPLSHRSWAQTF